MKRFRVRTIIAAGAAILGLSLGAAAQTSPALLNSLDVQRLVASNDPAANARLLDHFTALAATYEAEAREHSAMAQGFSGNPNHPAVGMSEHCKRLAEIATQEAATIKEIAAYHAQLATGAAATVPKNAAPYQAGKGATVPTEAHLHELAMSARTPADHRALEEYYVTVATKNDAAAAEHVTMAQSYRASARKGAADPATHCDRMVMLSRDAAKEARAAAAQHRQLANVG
jgi:hypothetical protein